MAPGPCGLLILLCFLGISTGKKKKKKNSHEACPALEVLVLSLPWGGLVGERGCIWELDELGGRPWPVFSIQMRNGRLWLLGFCILL